MNKVLFRVALFAGLMASGLIACARTPAAQEPDQSALEAAIGRWNKAVNARDAATLTALMTEDVELLDDATTVTGPDAAVRALREIVSHGQLGTWQTTS